jgi:hypothetical protein
MSAHVCGCDLCFSLRVASAAHALLLLLLLFSPLTCSALLLSLSAVAMSSVCDLCELKPATICCDECARDDFGRLCVACDMSMHGAKKANHKRRSIASAGTGDAATTYTPKASAAASPSHAAWPSLSSAQSALLA